MTNTAAATVSQNLARVVAMGPDTFNSATRDRIGGSDIAYIRSVWVATFGACASCGLAVDVKRDGIVDRATASVMGHLIPANYYGGNGGWIIGNIALMCFTCNADASDRVFSATDLMRPDIALAVWPKRSKAKRTLREECEETIARRAARNW